ncbi:MAG: NADPH:quinone reductase [Candidatus Korobacteraceae bacterium]
MKAIRVHEFGGPEVMKLEEVPDLVAGPGQVVIDVKAVGVNPVESYIRTGTYATKPNLPYTPGNDVAGVVKEVGSGVTGVNAGDRVYTSQTISGAYAGQALCNALNVHPLPDNVSFEQGAGVGVPYGTAYRALFQRGGATAAEAVLVHGASGGVGIASVQFARAAGLTVFGTAGSDAGMELAKREGAHHVLNHSKDGYLNELMNLTQGQGVNIILEMLANKNLGNDLNVIARHGRIVVIGNRGSIEINPRGTMAREADIRGVMLFGASQEEFQAMHAAIFAGLEAGTLRPIVGQKFALADAAKAHEAVMEHGGSYGKIILVP